ncbi:hypothetical protein JAAARDRAFT_56033 [Jaapia argillacea MUCL 33604]|uniref:3-beta hydroxysteroid dehydrogenase/isomerase domain-containing protein n=1 Tax=Jaapia argillacea MUCL 33604 TaxID=933084 RepID=A0A067PYX4_9AGAM|nr:hypothetical protein JAAARDRAFT_56033 [Jaapia argillacea MUCL 33604]
MSDVPRESYLVVGGAGFLGGAIVKALLARGETKIAIFDLVPRTFNGDVQVFVGDITDNQAVSSAIEKSGATCIFHTASPIHGLPPPIYPRVNVVGTRVVLDTAIAHKVQKFVYTSSTGVVYTGKPFDGVDEKTAPVVKKGWDAYHDTKAKGELMVLEANDEREGGLRTCAIRPCGMIGPDDKQVMYPSAKALQEGKANIQIGPNTALVDFVYVGNVADAHILAADKLIPSDPTSSTKVAGEAFFITNAQPLPFWDVQNLIYRELGHVPSPKEIKVIPRRAAMVLAFIFEASAKITRSKPRLEKYNVIYTTTQQVYCIDKARTVLGYEPKVSLEEGARLMVEWWKEEGYKKYQDKP